MLANESKGLSQSEPKETPKRGAQGHPDSRPRNAKRKGPRESHAEEAAAESRSPRPRTTRFPTDEGGPVSGPYGSFTSGATKGGFGFPGSGSGDFGSRFGWYVDVVRRKVRKTG